MALPQNILQNVVTYQEANLALLQTLNCFISTANKKFINFETLTAQLGSVVSFRKPVRFTSKSSLVASAQPIEQLVQNLAVDQQESVFYEYTSEQLIFNLDDYINGYGRNATAQLGAKIEANVALNCKTAPYRFFGNGTKEINTYSQLMQAIAMHRNFGSVQGRLKMYLQDTAVPAIINSGLSQYAINRNNEIAEDWKVGRTNMCDFYESSKLPYHEAGYVGQQGYTLTISAVGTADPISGAISQITCTSSGAIDGQPLAIKQYDRLQFIDGVAGKPNMRFLQWIGQIDSSSPVQLQCTATAPGTAGEEVVINFNPPLQANPVASQNVRYLPQVGMQLWVANSHYSGMLICDDALFLAMPKLPELPPYTTLNGVDKATGATFRQYFGSVGMGTNLIGWVHDSIWGSTAVPENAMAILFPANVTDQMT